MIHPLTHARLACLCLSLLLGCSESQSRGPEDEPETAPSADDVEPNPEPEPVPAPSVEPEPEPGAAEPTVEPEPEPGAAEPTVEPSVNVRDAAVPDPSHREDAGEAPEALVGVCGVRGEGTADDESFTGFEERYVIGDEGFGVDVCVVRFPVERVGDAPPGCVDLSGEPCAWSHELEYGEGEVVVDDGGACASSELGLDDAGIADLAGTRVSYAFVEEYVGHNSVLLVFDETRQTWVPSGNANWDDESGSFRFDRRDGLCGY